MKSFLARRIAAIRRIDPITAAISLTGAVVGYLVAGLVGGAIAATVAIATTRIATAAAAQIARDRSTWRTGRARPALRRRLAWALAIAALTVATLVTAATGPLAATLGGHATAVLIAAIGAVVMRGALRRPPSRHAAPQ